MLDSHEVPLNPDRLIPSYQGLLCWGTITVQQKFDSCGVKESAHGTAHCKAHAIPDTGRVKRGTWTGAGPNACLMRH